MCVCVCIFSCVFFSFFFLHRNVQFFTIIIMIQFTIWLSGDSFFYLQKKKFIIENQYLWDRSIFFTLFDDYFSIFIFSSFSSSFIRCLWIIYHWNYRRCCCCCCYGLYFFSLNFSSLWVFCDILHISLSLSPIHGINWYFFSLVMQCSDMLLHLDNKRVDHSWCFGGGGGQFFLYIARSIQITYLS